MVTRDEEMGEVVTSATIESVEDLFEVEKGERSPGDVRKVVVDDALLGTGATMQALPRRLLELSPAHAHLARLQTDRLRR